MPLRYYQLFIFFRKFFGLGQFAQVPLLELGIVKVVQIVKRPDAVAVAKQPLANVRADETRAAMTRKFMAER